MQPEPQEARSAAKDRLSVRALLFAAPLAGVLLVFFVHSWWASFAVPAAWFGGYWLGWSDAEAESNG